MIFTSVDKSLSRPVQVMRLLMPSTHRLRTLMLMESLNKVLLVPMHSKPFRTAQIRSGSLRTVDIPEPLDFMVRSSGWQFLDDQLTTDEMDNATLVLHPDLYLLQNASTTNWRQSAPGLTPLTSNHLTIRSLFADKSSLIYSCHTRITTRYPCCRHILPWAEVVRMLAQKMKLVSPWLIANSQYLWITDASGKLYECATKDKEHYDWLTSSLLSDANFGTNCSSIVDSVLTETQLRKRQFSSIKVNSQLESIFGMLTLLLQPSQ